MDSVFWCCARAVIYSEAHDNVTETIVAPQQILVKIFSGVAVTWFMALSELGYVPVVHEDLLKTQLNT